MKPRVLVVDDEATARDELCEALIDAGYAADGVGDAATALERVGEQSYEACISDIKMPGMSGIELLRELEKASPETAVIVITAYGDMETAIEALRAGAVDYVLKPVLFEEMLRKVKHLVEHSQLLRDVRNLRQVVSHRDSPLAFGMVGESEAMLSLVRTIEKVGPTHSNVLILGESGTGKELIARAVHDSSERKNEPFVPINGAAIPETLLESELFGHTVGSFTGAVGNKEGLLKTAGDGTIFLDELGDIPLSIQAKLLRAVETREIQPVGSTRRIPINARLITATNKNLQEQIEAGVFREDLYYRVAVVQIEVPALRERREDIPALVSFFVEKFNVEMRRNCRGADSQALRLLVGHGWRGNIRELENTIERAMIFAEGDYVTAEDLPSVVRGSEPIDPETCLNLAEAGKRFEREHIHKVLNSCSGDKRRAADILGVSLSSLYRKLNGRAT